MVPKAGAPRVSVCIPTYNYARYLPEAIDSVLGQSLTDFDLLIIDDASRDDTRQVVEEYARKDPRIDFRVNPVNLGMVENWNLCLREARGEFVKFLFGDDLLSSSDALQRMAGILDADPAVSLVAAARNVIDEGSRVKAVWSRFPDGTLTEGSVVIRRCLTEGKNLIGEPSVVMFRNSQAGRGFNPRYRQIVDLEMWFYLLEQGKFAFIGDPLCSFRIHPEQETWINIAELRHHEDTRILFAEYLDNPAKEYLDIGRGERAYLRYGRLYRIWKEHRQGRTDRESALRLIRAEGSLPSFFLAYPFYEVRKGFRRIWRRRSHRRS
jgi:glycosyltransferase involved in cell wall biosynthesis